MGIRRTGYVYTTPRKTFKINYIISTIFGVFAVACGAMTIYYDKELTKAKWKGLFIGALVQTAVLILVYVFCNLLNALPVGIIIFIAHFVHIILFGIFFGKKNHRENGEKDADPQ